jgi:hypothetical protein
VEERIIRPDYGAIMTEIFDDITRVNDLYDRWRQQISQSVINVKIYIQPVYPIRLSARVFTPPLPTGAVVGTDMGTNTAAVITKTSDVATRFGRGSIHLPGMVVEHIDADSNEWGAAYLAALADLKNAMLNTYTLDDFVELRPVLFSLKHPDRVTDVTGGIVQPTPRVERRRTLRVGS